MTGSDLIVLAPWLVFAVVLAVICLLLLRSTRASGHRSSFRTRRSRRRRDHEETRCPEKNAEARPR
jgi:hypothetical protein